MAPDGDVRTAADSRHDHGLVVVAAVVNGLSGYLVLLIAARTLSPAENADFLVFWGALFALFGVLVGIAAEITRAVHETASMSPGHVAGDTKVLPVVARLALVAAAVVAVTAPLWAGRLFGDRALPWTALLVAGVVLFPVHCAIVGVAAGRERWRTYALLVALDPLARLVLVVAAAALALGQDGLVAASALAAAYWLVLVPLRRPDLGWATSVALDRRGFVRRILGACSASAASAVLIVGFPVLVRATSPDAEFAAAAPILLAVSLCRAPLLVPLSVYQNVVVTRVMTRGLGALRGPALLIAAGTAAGMVAGALDRALGPSRGQSRLPRRAGDGGAAGAGRRAGVPPHADRRGCAGPGPAPALRAGLGGGQPRRGGGAGDALRPDASGGRLPAGRARGGHGGAPRRTPRHGAGPAPGVGRVTRRPPSRLPVPD